jgi:hypothetical protein
MSFLKSRLNVSMRTLLRRTARKDVRMYTREMSNMMLLPGNTVCKVGLGLIGEDVHQGDVKHDAAPREHCLQSRVRVNR